MSLLKGLLLKNLSLKDLPWSGYWAPSRANPAFSGRRVITAVALVAFSVAIFCLEKVLWAMSCSCWAVIVWGHAITSR